MCWEISTHIYTFILFYFAKFSNPYSSIRQLFLFTISQNHIYSFIFILQNFQSIITFTSYFYVANFQRIHIFSVCCKTPTNIYLYIPYVYATKSTIHIYLFIQCFHLAKSPTHIHLFIHYFYVEKSPTHIYNLFLYCKIPNPYSLIYLFTPYFHLAKSLVHIHTLFYLQNPQSIFTISFTVFILQNPQSIFIYSPCIIPFKNLSLLL